MPEVASRRHLELVVAGRARGARRRRTRRSTTSTASRSRRAPGLIGALLVGLAAAKALAWSRRLPLVPVDHLARPRRLALPPAGRRSSRRSSACSRAAATRCSLDVHAHTRAARPRLDARRRGRRGLRQGRAPARARLPGRRASSTGSRATATPTAYDFPVARVPGLDFSFSGLKTALLYATRDLAPEELERRAGRPRGLLPAGDRPGARRPRPGGCARRARPDRRRRRRRGELGAPGGPRRRRARAARAHDRQRRDDRLGGTLPGARPVPRLSWARCVRLALSRGMRCCWRSSRSRRRPSCSRPAARARARRRRPPTSAAGWRGLVGSRPRVALGQRVIVVLKTPSLAQRVAAAGGIVGTRRERAWTNSVARIAEAPRSRGSRCRASPCIPTTASRACSTASPRSSTRARSRSSSATTTSPASIPVRVAYPASISTRVLSRADFGPLSATGRSRRVRASTDAASRSRCSTPASIRRVPYLRGRVQHGIDVIGGNAGALAAVKPDDPTQLERHGTQMAGLLVGAGGPAGLAGVATGASVLPIRVAGWQPDALGHWAIYARSDQIIAGLERAVDPNDDGDAHDAARVALVALAEPFAAFADGPGGTRGRRRARPRHARRRARRQRRPRRRRLRRHRRAGRRAGGAHGRRGRRAHADRQRAHRRARRARDAARRHACRSPAPCGRRTARPELAVPRGTIARHAAHRAAAHRLLHAHGRQRRRRARRARADRARRRRRQQRAPRRQEPRRSCSTAAARRCRPAASASTRRSRCRSSRSRRAQRVPRSRGSRAASASPSRSAAARSVQNAEQGRVASFSSSGLAFDGRVKPDLVAPGVGLATSDPGANADGSPRFVTVNGSSAAAATVAGAAALLAQARPSLGASALAGLLVGTAAAAADRPGHRTREQGSSTSARRPPARSPRRRRRSRSGARPARAGASRPRSRVTNLSTRTLQLDARRAHAGRRRRRGRLPAQPEAASRSQQGKSVLVRLNAITASAPSGNATADGSVSSSCAAAAGSACRGRSPSAATTST